MKYRFISDHREIFRVGLMCNVLDVSRSGYYAWLNRPESLRKKENQNLATRIRVIHGQKRKTYGSPRIHMELNENGVIYSRNRVARIMKQEGIRGL